MPDPSAVSPIAVVLPTREAAVLRTSKSTAGQHSNDHYLPKPVGELVKVAVNSLSLE